MQTEKYPNGWNMKEVPCEGIVKIYVGGDCRAELTGEVCLYKYNKKLILVEIAGKGFQFWKIYYKIIVPK